MLVAVGGCAGGSDGPPREPLATSTTSSSAGAVATDSNIATPSSTVAGSSTEVAPRRRIPGFVVDHTSIDAFERIPREALADAKRLRVFYGRLSHGDQLLGGLDILKKTRAEYDIGAAIEPFYSSLDPGRDTPEWERATRDRLARGGSIDVVMWAWSGNVGRPDRGGTDRYVDDTLAKMDRLEHDFPAVQFVYFTGPAQAWAGATDYPKHNATIRKFAREHDKVLFDFEDIDLHAPDGSTRAGDTDACEWCDAWCKSHDCSMLGGVTDCSANHHTHCFNVYRKGLATWVLLARLAGWTG